MPRRGISAPTSASCFPGALNMSRVTCRHENGNEVVYGCDPHFGWFYQEFDGVGPPVVDRDFLSNGALLEALQRTNCGDAARQWIAMDLDPGQWLTEGAE